MKPKTDTHYFNQSRATVLNVLHLNNVGWEFKIGTKPVGSSGFRSELPDWEIVSEFRPHHSERVNRYAVYARKVEV